MEAEQEEELEVLRSIYEADACFKELSPTKFSYKVSYSEDAEDISKSFVLEVEWPADYPQASPSCSLNSFFNKHLSSATKATITAGLETQATENLGEAVTFTLFEWAKSELADTIESNVSGPESVSASVPAEEGSSHSAVSKKKEKKEQLTKAQKRRLAERFGAHADERPRGWDWVDVIRHLSKTGGAELT